MASSPTAFFLFDVLAKGLAARGYTFFIIVLDPKGLARGKKFVYDGLTPGALGPIIAKTFTLDDIAGAHRYMESNQRMGKTVVAV